VPLRNGCPVRPRCAAPDLVTQIRERTVHARGAEDVPARPGPEGRRTSADGSIMKPPSRIPHRKRSHGTDRGQGQTGALPRGSSSAQGTHRAEEGCRATTMPGDADGGRRSTRSKRFPKWLLVLDFESAGVHPGSLLGDREQTNEDRRDRGPSIYLTRVKKFLAVHLTLWLGSNRTQRTRSFSLHQVPAFPDPRRIGPSRWSVVPLAVGCSAHGERMSLQVVTSKVVPQVEKRCADCLRLYDFTTLRLYDLRLH
jgi:hypothetical protein